MMTDPIADMLTRIRNAQAVRKPSVEVPFSNLKKNIAEILNREGFIGDVRVTDEFPNKIIMELKYSGKSPKIKNIKRESKPGHRIYKKTDEIPHVLNGYGIGILSTSKGIMTDKEARDKKIGGELLCSIY